LNPFETDEASPGMTRNLGTAHRILRLVVAIAMFASSAVVPFSPLWLIVPGVYMLWSAGVGSCAGMRLLGVSTCRH